MTNPSTRSSKWGAKFQRLLFARKKANANRKLDKFVVRKQDALILQIAGFSQEKLQ